MDSNFSIYWKFPPPWVLYILKVPKHYVRHDYSLFHVCSTSNCLYFYLSTAGSGMGNMLTINIFAFVNKSALYLIILRPVQLTLSSPKMTSRYEHGHYSNLNSGGASHLKCTRMRLYFLIGISFCLKYFEKYGIVSTWWSIIITRQRSCFWSITTHPHGCSCGTEGRGGYQ